MHAAPARYGPGMASPNSVTTQTAVYGICLAQLGELSETGVQSLPAVRALGAGAQLVSDANCRYCGGMRSQQAARQAKLVTHANDKGRSHSNLQVTECA